MNTPALTVQQVAERLAVPTNKILQLIGSGQLSAIDVSANPGVGRPRWRIDAEALDAFINRRTRAAGKLLPAEGQAAHA